jgi:hypothetical protein
MELRRENADAKQAIRTATGSRAPAEQPPAIGDPDCDRFPAADAASDYGCVDWYQYWPQSSARSVDGATADRREPM